MQSPRIPGNGPLGMHPGQSGSLRGQQRGQTRVQGWVTCGHQALQLGVVESLRGLGALGRGVLVRGVL